jgi:hypothetical protein
MSLPSSVGSGRSLVPRSVGKEGAPVKPAMALARGLRQAAAPMRVIPAGCHRLPPSGLERLIKPLICSQSNKLVH